MLRIIRCTWSNYSFAVVLCIFRILLRGWDSFALCVCACVCTCVFVCVYVGGLSCGERSADGGGRFWWNNISENYRSLRPWCQHVEVRRSFELICDEWRHRLFKLEFPFIDWRFCDVKIELCSVLWLLIFQTTRFIYIFKVHQLCPHLNFLIHVPRLYGGMNYRRLGGGVGVIKMTHCESHIW